MSGLIIQNAVEVSAEEVIVAVRRLTITAAERQVLAQKRWLPKSHKELADLFAPFKQAFLQYAVRNYAPK